MIDRISKNEERLDKLLININDLKKSIDSLKSNKKDLILLKKYYGSKNWFKDKEAYEKNSVPKIKAGVLSEDIVWNMLEELDSMVDELNQIKR